MNEMVNEVKESAEFNRKVRDRIEELERAERKGLEQGLEIGRAEAREEKIQNAKNLKMEGISLETIARCIGLPLTTVEAI